MGPDVKAGDDFLDLVFKNFYERLGLPNLMRNTNYHTLALHVPETAIGEEVRAKLDLILQTAGQARPRND